MSETTERFVPTESEAGAPFWTSSRDEVLVLPWCASCDEPHWYPRGFCPTCLRGEIEWRSAAGTGVIHAVSVQPKPAHPGLASRTPYAVALVDLDEGVRLMLSMAVDDPWAVRVGDRIRVGWEPLPDGRNLPVAMAAD